MRFAVTQGKDPPGACCFAFWRGGWDGGCHAGIEAPAALHIMNPNTWTPPSTNTPHLLKSQVLEDCLKRTSTSWRWNFHFCCPDLLTDRQALSTHSRRRPRREAAETAAEVVAQRAASRLEDPEEIGRRSYGRVGGIRCSPKTHERSADHRFSPRKILTSPLVVKKWTPKSLLLAVKYTRSNKPQTLGS